MRSEFARAVKALGQAKRGEPLIKLASYEDFSASQFAQPQRTYDEPVVDTNSVTINQRTLRGHIEQIARERGLVFVPIKSEQGRQIYNLGSRNIYFDSTAIFCMDNVTRDWMPVSIPQLLQMDL
uniref:Circularly permuted type 2 ATP-grasp protein n=1 Tax=Bursaphelenchus xylophilus TaxID=6326 RepID=A0A1I7RQT7_BURXY